MNPSSFYRTYYMLPKSLLSIAIVSVMHMNAPLAINIPVQKYTSKHTIAKFD